MKARKGYLQFYCGRYDYSGRSHRRYSYTCPHKYRQRIGTVTCCNRICTDCSCDWSSYCYALS